MNKWLSKVIIAWIIGVLFFLYFDGIEKMYFHQDDILLLAGLTNNFKEFLLQSAAGHLIFLFNLFYFLEWKIFHLNFNGYLFVSIVLHAAVVGMVMKITYTIGKNKTWALLSGLAVTINSNFYEVIWMSSSQMMSMSTLFSLVSLWLVIKIQSFGKIKPHWLLLLFMVAMIPGFTWGTGLPMPFWLLLAFGFEKNKENKIQVKEVFWPLLAAQVCLVLIYFRLASNTSSVYVHPQGYLRTVYEMIRFTLFAFAYSVIGRYFFPFANRIGRQIVFILSFLYLIRLTIQNRLDKLVFKHSRLWFFALIVLLGSYMLISLPRWQFGLGQAAAPRYAYLQIMFLSIAIFSTLANLKIPNRNISKLMIVLLLLSALSLGAYTQVTVKWTERPGKNRELFKLLQNIKPDQCITDGILPWYIIESDQWTLSYIWPIFNKNFNPFSNDDGCIKIKRDITIPWSPVEKTSS